MIRENRKPPKYLEDVVGKQNKYGVRRILVDGKRPIWEKDGKFFRSYAEAIKE